MIWITPSLVSSPFEQSEWKEEKENFSLILQWNSWIKLDGTYLFFFRSLARLDKWLNLRKVKICKRGLTNLRTDINNELRKSTNETLAVRRQRKKTTWASFSTELNILIYSVWVRLLLFRFEWKRKTVKLKRWNHHALKCTNCSINCLVNKLFLII